jgi:hypothetical protein
VTLFSITSVFPALTDGLVLLAFSYRKKLEQDSQEIETAIGDGGTIRILTKEIIIGQFRSRKACTVNDRYKFDYKNAADVSWPGNWNLPGFS